MNILHPVLAQQIVSRAMEILPCNVNIMDSLGIIIASGDSSRIHTQHEGAQLVLANQRVVEIDESAASALRGVQPGINLPILHHQRLVGVIGITGELERVRPYAELLKMTAEMLLVQGDASHLEQLHQQQRTRLIKNLLDPSQKLHERAKEARQLGLHTAFPRQACLLELHASASSTPVITDLLNQIQYLPGDHWCAIVSPTSLLWCPPLPHPPITQDWLEQQFGTYEKDLLRLAIAGPAHDITALHHASMAASHLVAWAQTNAPDERILILDDHHLSILIYRHRDDWQVNMLLEPTRLLLRHRSGAILGRTLLAWIETDQHIDACATRLGIHRNSLNYRLKQVRTITGMDPNQADHLTRLTLGLQLAGVKDALNRPGFP